MTKEETLNLHKELEHYLKKAEQRYNEGDIIESIFTQSSDLYKGDAQIYIGSDVANCGIVANSATIYLYYRGNNAWARIAQLGPISKRNKELEDIRKIIGNE